MRSSSAFVTERCDAVPMAFPGLLTWDYSHADDALVRLYDKAKRSQWNAATDVDWTIDVDLARQVDTILSDPLRNTPGSPIPAGT